MSIVHYHERRAVYSVVFHQMFIGWLPSDFRTPAAEVDGLGGNANHQSMPSVESDGAEQTFDPVRFVFPIGP
jgi:hypothetical protein